MNFMLTNQYKVVLPQMSFQSRIIIKIKPVKELLAAAKNTSLNSKNVI